MPKIILGGGLSGLSAAYYLSRLTNIQKIALVESSGRLGGWIKSEKVSREAIFERGPRTIRPHGPAGINTLNLLDNLGLSSEIRPITSNNNAAANKRFIYVDGELVLLPTNPFSLFITQKPFSRPILLHLLGDLVAKPKMSIDESVYKFTKRRFGSEIADYLIDSVICGICAGNSREVSVKFLMKKAFDYEQNHGSVLKGMLNNYLFGKKNERPQKMSRLAYKSRQEKWNVYTFNEGLETLPVALQTHLSATENVDIELNSRCEEIVFEPNKVLLKLDNDEAQLQGSQLISSISAQQLAPLVKNQHPKLSRLLSKIKTVTVGVVNVFYRENILENPAFGFLVPPKEKMPILGVTYDSCLRNEKNCTVLTVMMGGFWFEQLFGASPRENDLADIAKDNLKRVLHISKEPDLVRVHILKNCIPQYVVGHESNLQEIEEYIRTNRLPLFLCGSSYNGVGVNDVILSAKSAVEHLVKE